MAVVLGLESPMMVRIPELRAIGEGNIEGELMIPANAYGIALIAHGSGSSRFSPRNRSVAQLLRDQGLGTFLVDLLAPQETAATTLEESIIQVSTMAQRICAARRWLQADPTASRLPVGILGAGTGAAAALVAMADQPGIAQALVLRGARIELACLDLPKVRVPTLLIAGARDALVAERNREMMDKLGCPIRRFELIPGASHGFAEPGALAAVAFKTSNWFCSHLAPTDLIDKATLARYAYIEPGGSS